MDAHAPIWAVAGCSSIWWSVCCKQTLVVHLFWGKPKTLCMWCVSHVKQHCSDTAFIMLKLRWVCFTTSSFTRGHVAVLWHSRWVLRSLILGWADRWKLFEQSHGCFTWYLCGTAQSLWRQEVAANCDLLVQECIYNEMYDVSVLFAVSSVVDGYTGYCSFSCCLITFFLWCGHCVSSVCMLGCGGTGHRMCPDLQWYNVEMAWEHFAYAFIGHMLLWRKSRVTEKSLSKGNASLHLDLYKYHQFYSDL